MSNIKLFKTLLNENLGGGSPYFLLPILQETVPLSEVFLMAQSHNVIVCGKVYCTELYSVLLIFTILQVYCASCFFSNFLPYVWY